MSFIGYAVGWGFSCVRGVNIFGIICALCEYSLFTISMMSLTSVIIGVVSTNYGALPPSIGNLFQSFNSALCHVVLRSVLPLTFGVGILMTWLLDGGWANSF